jgi:hypothetical protein
MTMGINRREQMMAVGGPFGTFKMKKSAEPDQKIVFVTIDDLLQYKKVLYTTLDYDMKQQNQS